MSLSREMQATSPALIRPMRSAMTVRITELTHSRQGPGSWQRRLHGGPHRTGVRHRCLRLRRHGCGTSRRLGPSAVWPAGCVPASCPEPPWLGVLVARTAPCAALPAAVTVVAAAATGAFAAADAVDVTVPAALTAVPDAVASDWVVLSSAWLAPVTVAATVAAWPV